MLTTIQSKYDYAPKENPGTGITGPGSPTSACDNVCRALLEAANTVRSHQVGNVLQIAIFKIFYFYFSLVHEDNFDFLSFYLMVLFFICTSF